MVAQFAFNPTVITVSTGTTVVWRNEDLAPHTVTSTDGEFDSGIFDPGSSFTFTFNEPGSFDYVCQLHPQMQGSVTVEGDADASASQAATPSTIEVGGTDSSDASTPQERVGGAVSLVDFAFEPATLRVAAGETVVWSNDGVAPHTVTGDFADSGMLNSGETFSYTFESSGRFDYVCAFHPNMVGSVEVSSRQLASATPVSGATDETVSPAGFWLLELIPVHGGLLDVQRALVAFHPDGLLEADFAAAPGEGIPGSLLTTGRGEWVVQDGQWGITLAALVTDPQQRFVATLELSGEGQPGAGSAEFEGSFTFEIVSADGGMIEQGSGALRGRQLSSTP
jgi:plastocyanin